MLLNVLGCQLTYEGQAETNAEAWFNIALCPWKPEGSLGRTAQDSHLDSHTAPELCVRVKILLLLLYGVPLQHDEDSDTFSACWVILLFP